MKDILVKVNYTVCFILGENNEHAERFSISGTSNLKNRNDTSKLSNELNVLIDPPISGRNISRGIILVYKVIPMDDHP